MSNYLVPIRFKYFVMCSHNTILSFLRGSDVVYFYKILVDITF